MEIFGVAYHSPLDIVSLLPNDIKCTTDRKKEADVCFTRRVTQNVNAKIQIVFASHRDLVKASIPIIDQGDGGQILNSKQIKWNLILKG